jgi:hypothetical protein
MYTWNDGTYLAHHGIKGQRWGIRRFQNPDGSLTEAGRRRYGDTFDRAADKARSLKKMAEGEQKKWEKQLQKANASGSSTAAADAEWNKVVKKYPGLAKEVGNWKNVDDDELWDVLEYEYGANLSGLKKAIKSSGKNKTDDLQRWINVTKQQQKYYETLANRYGSIPYGKLDKKLAKEARKFVDHAIYENADYTDVQYGGGRVDNYQLDIGSRDRYR